MVNSKFTQSNISALQILFVDERHHWILSSLHGSDVIIYDSSSSLPLTPSVEQQLFQLYGLLMPNGSSDLLVTSAPVQQQRGSCDCGVFTIANAFHIASGNDLEYTTFDQTKMRSHLIQCFEERLLSPFPSSSEPVIRNKHTYVIISANK